MTTVYGNWAVTWSDSAHSGVNRQHLLRTPLQRIRPGAVANQHTATSLDYSVQNTIVFGTAYEVAAKVTAEDNAQSLVDMIEAGLQGKTLTLIDLAQTDRSVDVYLTDPADAWLATYDMHGTPWEFESELRFRRTDGSAFPDWLLYQAYGTEGLLFKYVAGQSLEDATFTRGVSANYVNVSGVTTAAGPNVARDAHYQTIASTWTRTLRLESSETEVLSLPFTHKPQAMTVYVKFEAQNAATSGERIIAQRPTGAADDNWEIYGAGTGFYTASYFAGGTQRTATTTDAVAADDEVELLLTLSSAGLLKTQPAINGTAGSVVTSTVLALPTAWDESALRLGSWGGGDYGTADFLEVKVLAGVQTLDTCRSR